MTAIEKEIQQKSFSSNRHKAHINILFTASYLSSVTNKALKPFGISAQQYNLMRILKGQHPRAASIKLLTERMLDKMSNASRLVEKLRVKGYISRVECPEDRRQVNVKLTDEGLKVLEDSTKSMDVMARFMDNLTEEEAGILSDYLDKIRD